ncbi:dodecin domain-containing protein [Nonlabens sp.]
MFIVNESSDNVKDSKISEYRVNVKITLKLK